MAAAATNGRGGRRLAPPPAARRRSGGARRRTRGASGPVVATSWCGADSAGIAAPRGPLSEPGPSACPVSASSAAEDTLQSVSRWKALIWVGISVVLKTA